MPLEVWDLVVDGVGLYRADRGPGFGALLGRAVEMLVDGSQISESWPSFPAACREVQQVVLVGGAAEGVVWRSRLPARVAADAERCAERGGRTILERMGKRGLVVDLGQSRLKICGARRWVYARDLAAIPISRRPVEEEGRATLIHFVAAGLREATAAAMPEAIVMALPCEIDEDGALGTCSYPWHAGDLIVGEFLMEAGLAGVPVVLMNDAELAAIGVAEGEAITATTLVLTLGFGVGGALIRGEI